MDADYRFAVVMGAGVALEPGAVVRAPVLFNDVLSGGVVFAASCFT